MKFEEKLKMQLLKMWPKGQCKELLEPRDWAEPCRPASPVLAQPQDRRKSPVTATETSMA